MSLQSMMNEVKFPDWWGGTQAEEKAKVKRRFDWDYNNPIRAQLIELMKGGEWATLEELHYVIGRSSTKSISRIMRMLKKEGYRFEKRYIGGRTFKYRMVK